MANRSIRPIRIDGNVAYVPLTRGYEAVIDAADAPLIEGRNWSAKVNRRAVYAVTKIRLVNGKQGVLWLHRLIMGDPAEFNVDHIDGNGLYNCRSNLRLATASQNKFNSRRSTNNTSGFKGVSWHPGNAKWRAYISFEGKKHHLGYYDTPDTAHSAYAVASAKLHGEFGRSA